MKLALWVIAPLLVTPGIGYLALPTWANCLETPWISHDSIAAASQTAAPQNTEAELERLLQERLDHPEQAATIDAEIQATFGATQAILVMDSSGFSRRSQDEGIIAALAEVERMRRIVVPVIESNAGSIFKLEVDNVYAVFPTVEQAIAAAHHMIQQTSAVDIHVSIGIGYGNLLMISNQGHYSNVYGSEMNLASKLGEDLATADQILITESTFQALNAATESWQMEEREISGLTLRVYTPVSDGAHRQD